MIARYPKSGKTADYLENWFYQHLKVVICFTTAFFFFLLQLNDRDAQLCGVHIQTETAA